VEPYGPHSPEVAALLARATILTAAEIARLDAADSAHALGRDAAWVLLRDRTKLEPLRTWRFAARAAARAAIETAAAREGLDLAPDQDDYWRVVSSPGAGAARAVRFAACALVAPETLDPVELEYLLEPWARVIGGRA
jgi:hypothetical protein